MEFTPEKSELVPTMLLPFFHVERAHIHKLCCIPLVSTIHYRANHSYYEILN